MSYHIDGPVPEQRPLRERIIPPAQPRLAGPPAATTDQWRAAYDRKVAEFAAETRKTSTLITALHALGCRAGCPGHCAGCHALHEVGALSPLDLGHCSPNPA